MNRNGEHRGANGARPVWCGSDLACRFRTSGSDYVDISGAGSRANPQNEGVVSVWSPGSKMAYSGSNNTANHRANALANSRGRQ